MAIRELQTNSIKIDKLRNKIQDGDIKIPPFQRKFVWKREHIISLLDSIYNDYPIGSILLWSTNEILPSTREIGGFKLPEKKTDYPINYVLDGQQRITSIFGVFCTELEQTDSEYSIDVTSCNIYFDLDELKFYHYDDLNPNHTNLRLRLLFDNYEFNIEISKYDREKSKSAVELQSLFQNYELPITTVTKRGLGEVGIIFERINNTGASLTTLDLMIAWSWSEEYHLKDEFDELRDILEQKGFDGIKEKIILQCVSSIIKNTTVTKEILNLKPEDIRNNTELVKTSLEKAIDYISTQFNVESVDFLPNSHQIVSLTYLFSKINHLTLDQSEIIKMWFWRTSFSNRYAGSTDIKMNGDIELFDQILKNNFDDIRKYKSNPPHNLFKKQKLIKSNPYVKATLLLIAQKNPLDLTNANKIDLGNALSSYNRKEYHHVFPQKYLKQHGFSADKINLISNFCFLPANSNKIISDLSPSVYFSKIPKLKEVLDSNVFPQDISIYMNDDYDMFIEKRSELLEKLLLEHTRE